ncbi:hypothetical protein O0235_01300 [Tepidiforma flava]|uniref:GAF domain-containing protein n=1 Tax=Tepidiforma flava TaxID=3004094 RepID=A0ABY7M7Z2_9CHLR|nr:hypothetical protein [Tepidiforma flava]WBL36267.1 hypothetical protein O0235_01300 [Tepidiforma flava]
MRTFDAPVADPAVEMGRAIAAATGAPTRVDAAARAVSGIIRVMRADRAAVLRCIDTGGFVPVAGLPATAVIGPREPFAGRWVLEQRTAAAFPAAEGWAPAAFAAETRAAWVALAPLGGTEIAAAFRCTNVPFYRGELERLEALAMAVAPALGAGPAARPWAPGRRAACRRGRSRSEQPDRQPAPERAAASTTRAQSSISGMTRYSSFVCWL